MNRRHVLLAVLLVVGCRGQATTEQTPLPTPRAAARMQIVYEIDLAKAVDDRHVVIRRDLQVGLDDKKIRATVRLTPEGITITPEDPAKLPDIEALLQADYAETIERHACGPALCVQTSASMQAAIKKVALGTAIETVRHRLEAMKVRDPKVVARGEQIVVELDAGEARAKPLIARTGKLEFKVVDHNSDFMRGVYALSAEDPRARELGIETRVDQWRVESGGSINVDYFFIAKDRSAIEKYFAEVGKRDPRYRVPDDRQIGYELVQGVWRSYYVERATSLTGADVANAVGSWQPDSNRAVVLLDFTRAGAQTLADVTARNVGRKLATILDDQIRSAPIINGTIAGGKVSIDMGGTDPAVQEADRDELVNVLKTGSLPAPLREVSATPVP